MANARKTALNILLKIQQENAYSNLALKSVLKASQLSAVDSAFCSALVYGVLERKITLDYIISSYSKMPLKKIEPAVLLILEMAVLQLLFMDKIPQSAAVNEAVKLARARHLNSAAGFINGILRSITRAQVPYTLPDENNKTKHLSIKYSVPEQIISLWFNSYGEEITVNMLSSLCGRPPIAVRVNTNLCSKSELISQFKSDGIKAEDIPFLRFGVWVSGTGALDTSQAFKKGLFFVQDAASQLLCELVNPTQSLTVTDVCSAPGGKAFNLSMLMKNKGKVNAFDLYEHKAKLIKSTADRLKIDNIFADVRDASTASDGEMSDVVLCDVPCSGLGVLRRKPEIRYKKDFGFSELSDIQYRILDNSKKLVKSGGVLFYSTCTLNPGENNKTAERFLRENKDFKPYKLNLPNGISRILPENENEITLFPHANNTDGFYISAFSRR